MFYIDENLNDGFLVEKDEDFKHKVTPPPPLLENLVHAWNKTGILR